MPSATWQAKSSRTGRLRARPSGPVGRASRQGAGVFPVTPLCASGAPSMRRVRTARPPSLQRALQPRGPLEASCSLGAQKGQLGWGTPGLSWAHADLVRGLATQTGLPPPALHPARSPALTVPPPGQAWPRPGTLSPLLARVPHSPGASGNSASMTKARLTSGQVSVPGARGAWPHTGLRRGRTHCPGRPAGCPCA